MSVLTGVRVVEFEGLGPAPFCGMLLADLGADVILIERPPVAGGAPAQIFEQGAGYASDAAAYQLFRRGKRSIVLDLKSEKGRAAALAICARADALIEGLRPGVMERLGLGPEPMQAANPRLVYGRVTGWGQSGPLAHAAGHDINYLGLSGAAWYSGAPGSAPLPPPTLVGDVGGGALYLAVGVLGGVLNARATGKGTVVDAAIVDGAAHMMGLLLALRAAGGLPDARGSSMLDGAPFYNAYPCADGAWISFGSLEPKFYALLVEKLGLADDPLFVAQYDQTQWPAAREKLARIIAARPRADWDALFEGTDVCYAPILPPGLSKEHPHMKARGVWREQAGLLQAAAAPRFDGAAPRDPAPAPGIGQHTEEILRDAGL